MRYFLEIAYKGTNFAGFQVQTNKVTIQGELTKYISTVFNEELNLTGAGRTDAGVHALQSFVHFDTEKPVPDQFLLRINSLLPQDIVVKKIIEVNADAHARFDATERSYKYFIHFEKDPFRYDNSFHYPYLPLNIEKMKAATALLPSFKDFAPLSKKNEQVKTTFCDIQDAYWESLAGNTGLVFYISANRFLRNMVRRIVGALLMIGKEKITVDEFENVMQQKKSLRINISVPPQGLFLNSVKYPYIN